MRGLDSTQESSAGPPLAVSERRSDRTRSDILNSVSTQTS